MIGNFWVDLVRGTYRLLLPFSVVAAVVLLAGGVIQNLNGFTDATTLAGAAQSIPGGPVASQEAIKLLGTNGGGFFNVNSAHPFENPAPWTNLFEIFLMLVIPFSLPRAFGRIVGDDHHLHERLELWTPVPVAAGRPDRLDRPPDSVRAPVDPVTVAVSERVPEAGDPDDVGLSTGEAQHSTEEHAEIVAALAAKDADKAVQLMQEHLDHVEASLIYDRKVPSHDIAIALT